MNCKDCEKYLTCTALCDEAKQYTNQDINKKAWSKITPTDQIEKIQASKMPLQVGTTEIILQLYFIDRKNSKEIADTLYKSKRYINKVLHKYKSILQENIKKSV